jgi:plasmid stabilization system protein ParE
MKILWSVASVRHLQQVVEYIRDPLAVGAATVRRRIFETVSRLGKMPYSGREGRIPRTREAVVPGTAYIVVYRIEAETVEVLGIWHTARDGPASL